MLTPEELDALLETALAHTREPLTAAAARKRCPLDRSLRQWVASASDIATKMELDEAALVCSLATQQRTVGILSGSPTVLFVRPEGLRRE